MLLEIIALVYGFISGNIYADFKRKTNTERVILTLFWPVLAPIGVIVDIIKRIKTTKF